MQPRISVLTLGADDLDRAMMFYRDGLVECPREVARSGASFAPIVELSPLPWTHPVPTARPTPR